MKNGSLTNLFQPVVMLRLVLSKNQLRITNFEWPNSIVIPIRSEESVQLLYNVLPLICRTQKEHLAKTLRINYEL